MSKNHSALGAYLIALMFAGCSAAYAQATYPAKTIRIVTAAAGGASDFAARVIAQGLTSSFGQQVIVDNRGGGSGVIAAQIVTKSPPDGYTLLLFTSPIWLLPFVQDNVPYDPVTDFAPVSLIDRSPSVLVVHPSLPVKSVRALIDLAKARPGQLNYSRASAGGPSHLAAELFKTMAGITLVEVPYKGGGPAVLALLGGEVELSFASAGAAAAPIKLKRLRALAVTTAEPSVLFPELPTIAASGLPGFESILVNGMFAPAGTPASIINRLNQEIVQILHRPDVKERFLNTGMETVGTSPEKFEAFVKSEMAKWGKVIKSVGIRGG
ncbi:MAG: tripartite tricarboxylate transporter substrate binding protein [Betaproteobacteria bacterium]|nr:tripartite tricarboxylate transporter substrate binding protein [Betaproteobacteria bacterium]